ncbi:MAG: UDP-2,3-diacylglucosamine diphosphatase LpxI [Pseudomonadota bacterium]
MERIAVIAGNGALPQQIAVSLHQQGKLAGVIGVNRKLDWAGDLPSLSLGFGQLGKLWSQLRRWEVGTVVFAGGVSERPDFRTFKLDFGTIASLPRVVAALAGGDDAVLRAVADIFYDKGFPVVGLRECAPDLLAGQGSLGQLKPDRRITADLEEAYSRAKALGAMDAGQAAVVERGRIVALEAAEGTDAMLARVASLRSEGRISPQGGGVLVKCAKPKQDLRFDLPTIGMETLKLASEAGLAAIGIEEQRTIVLDQRRVLETANISNMVIYGFASTRDRHG